jgi:type IV pilus assembly protein PilQ
VLIPDGETAVIGGLLKVNATTENKGVPGVSRIPILGWLFKSSSKTKANKELMIFLTPKILDQSFFKIEPAGLDRKKTGTGDVGIVSPNL